MKKQTNNKNRIKKQKRNIQYNNRKNKQNIKKKNLIKLNKIHNRKELLEKIRINDSTKLPNDLSFCFIGKLAKKNKGFGFVEPIENNKLHELSKKYNKNFNLFHEDIYVKRELSLNANNNDIVLVRIVDEKRHYEGKIIKILERNLENITGIYEKNSNFGFVKPIDKSFSTDIYISKNDNLNAKNGDAVLVKITKYPEKDKKTEGKIIKIITNEFDPLLSLKILLTENNIEKEFPNKVKKELEYIPNEVDEKDLKNRTNYINLKTYTIDGENAKDFDDAISIHKSGNFYHLYIHIADVSHYVKENSEIDQEARLRGFSIYLINTVIPMLDFKISNNICSLIEGKNRLTLTVYLKIDKKGNIIYQDISKSYINVDRRMTYSLVQNILDNNINDIDKNDFKIMEELALILKQKREKSGYINFNIPEIEFLTNNEGKIINIRPEQKYFSDEIIEQFMLITNEVIGKFLKEKDIPNIYRVHETPDIDKVLEIKEVIEALGFKMNFLDNKKYLDTKKVYNKKTENKYNKNKTITNFRKNIKQNKKEEKFNSTLNIEPIEYANFLKNIEGDPLEEIISNILLRTLKIAKYSHIDLGHFGIATKNYTHFTAPIRRYTDLFVHRILKKVLDNTLTINEKNQYAKQAKTIAEGSTMIESKIVGIEREYYDIKTAEFMEEKIGEEFKGIISSITHFGIYVKILGSIEGLIRYVNMEEFIEFDEKTKQAISKKTNKIYKLGDKVKIKVTDVNIEEGNIDFIFI